MKLMKIICSWAYFMFKVKIDHIHIYVDKWQIGFVCSNAILKHDKNILYADWNWI